MTRTRNWNGICFPFGTMATEQNPVIACSSPHLPDSMQLGWPAFKDWSFIYLLVPGKCNRRGEREKKKKEEEKQMSSENSEQSSQKKKDFLDWQGEGQGFTANLKRVKNQEMQGSWTDFFTWKCAGAQLFLSLKSLSTKNYFTVCSQAIGKSERLNLYTIVNW